VEQLPALRAIPNLLVVRPADGPETAAAWTQALERRDAPTAIVLSRQELPVLARPAGFDMATILRGGYVLSDAAPPSGAPAPGVGGGDAGRVVLIASGSEVSSAVEAQAILAGRGVASRVVSMPCPQQFRRQPEDYRRGVVPGEGPKVVIEAAVTQGWEA